MVNPCAGVEVFARRANNVESPATGEGREVCQYERWIATRISRRGELGPRAPAGTIWVRNGDGDTVTAVEVEGTAGRRILGSWFCGLSVVEKWRLIWDQGPVPWVLVASAAALCLGPDPKNPNPHTQRTTHTYIHSHSHTRRDQSTAPPVRGYSQALASGKEWQRPFDDLPG